MTISALPGKLAEQIDTAGYYPAFVTDVLEIALAGEPVTAHLVHGETTFDADTIRRHLSVLVLTANRLIFVHADDHAGDEEHIAQAHGVATSEAVPLSAVRSVMLTHVVGHPANYPVGTRAKDIAGREITLSIGWGSVSRVDLEVATCGDPNCDADHGYTGTLTADDLAIRISADAEGAAALQDALSFARTLSAATAHNR